MPARGALHGVREAELDQESFRSLVARQRQPPPGAPPQRSPTHKRGPFPGSGRRPSAAGPLGSALLSLLRLGALVACAGGCCAGCAVQPPGQIWGGKHVGVWKPGPPVLAVLGEGPSEKGGSVISTVCLSPLPVNQVPQVIAGPRSLCAMLKRAVVSA